MMNCVVVDGVGQQLLTTLPFVQWAYLFSGKWNYIFCGKCRWKSAHPGNNQHADNLDFGDNNPMKGRGNFLAALFEWIRLANDMAICKQIALSRLSPSPDLFFSGPSRTAGWLALTPITMMGVQRLQTANQIEPGQSGAAKGWDGLGKQKTVMIRG